MHVTLELGPTCDYERWDWTMTGELGSERTVSREDIVALRSWNWWSWREESWGLVSSKLAFTGITGAG